MQIRTPSGYKNAALITVGAEVCAFDAVSGAAIVNTVENVQEVDAATFRNWHNPVFLINDEEHFALHSLLVLRYPKNAPDSVMVRDLVVGDQVYKLDGGDYVFDFVISTIAQVEPYPDFTWYLINGTYWLFREQSVWRNGTNVCHARDLVVGDEIYDDADQPVAITSIEPSVDDSRVWYRFDIDGDHSYIVDGLTVHNASRFWVGGTGTWDSSTTTHWAASSGTTGGQSVPGSSDTVTLDGSSGGGTVTLNFGGTITIQSLTMGAFTGTFDNSVNNNPITMSLVGGTAFNLSGSATRTITLGSATYTMSGSTTFSASNIANMTFSGASSTIVMSGSGKTFNGATLTFGTVTFGAATGTATTNIIGTSTFGTMNIAGPNYVTVPNSGGPIITTLNCTGTSSNQVFLSGISSGAGAISVGGSIGTWCAIWGITFTGSPSASNSFGVGNSGITITPPSGASAIYGMVG
ncbi:hypothetical protein [Bradyrhizobium sp. USDA 4545]|uniref:hypothetical protein n=1 Tax=Bradyrhizobium sp. USDA 4545 TaxID=2817705 RepID=UPI0020A50E2B|nr:hypothetical protein [Bradyrhizobium sp. USDA 4545]MCP1832846.1 hypothetical protein [Bradyrhizobium sp. USDA 4545]